ncbi:TlpA disulfide reductase family protein [uncultured Kordia sp.]|uniref:TlpA disulfide reductase family protein n=1 Tax=uncultured Kordia sp. TaxID=507699 RepID=UPI0026343249|nr:TlpA disulfide reductase family protein [uncultured Kordia sp.]
MKKVFLIACVAGMFLFTSCGGKQEEDNRDNSYAVETTIDGMPDGMRAFLKVRNEQGQPVSRDTAIVQNGKFTFYGTSDVPEMGFIYINGAQGNINFIIEKGDIKVQAERNSLSKAKITGGKHNQEYTDFVTNSQDLSAKIKSINQRYAVASKSKDSASVATLKQQAKDLETQGTNFQKDYIKEHPDSFISIQLVNRMLRYKVMPVTEVKAFYDKLPEDMKQTKVAREMNQKIMEMKRAAIGSIAPDFKAPNPQGELVSLYDIRGKVTIIDFWAAWCGPCRRENPNVVSIYNKYHADGLEIIGVSLDGRQGQGNAKQDWIKAIEQDGLPWHQVSNLAGFKDGTARTYNVRSIPATFILNEKGEIVAKNLRGAQLEAKVKELLGK